MARHRTKTPLHILRGFRGVSVITERLCKIGL